MLHLLYGPAASGLKQDIIGYIQINMLVNMLTYHIDIIHGTILWFSHVICIIMER